MQRNVNTKSRANFNLGLALISLSGTGSRIFLYSINILPDDDFKYIVTWWARIRLAQSVDKCMA